MKNIIKNVFVNLFRFIACNILGFIPGFIIAFLVSMVSRYTILNYVDEYSILIYCSMTFGFIISFYILYFLRNKKYKKLYLDKSYEGYSIKNIMGIHIKMFTKYELPVIFVISVLLSLVPSVTLGKSGMSFLFSSSGFFAAFMPVYVFGNEDFIVRLICYVLWDIYIVLCYFGCLRMAYRHWNKTRLRKLK